MSLEFRVEKLESEMLQVRKMLHKKDENQHQVWNDMQEELLQLSQQNAHRLDRLESTVSLMQTDIRQLQSDVSQLQSDVSQLQSDVSQLQSDVSQLQSDVSQLQSDVSQLQSDVGILKTDITEVKAMLRTLLERK